MTVGRSIVVQRAMLISSLTTLLIMLGQADGGITLTAVAVCLGLAWCIVSFTKKAGVR